MKEIILIIVSACLIENYPLMRFLGLGTIIENHNLFQKIIISVSILIELVLSIIIIWPINRYLIKDSVIYQNIVFTIIIILVSYLINSIIKKIYNINTMKILINGAVLGSCLQNVNASYINAVITSFSIGLGILIVIILFNSIYEKIDKNKILDIYQELPIKLVILSVMTLIIMALYK